METNGWLKSTLGSIATPDYGLVDGPFGSNLPASLYTFEGVPVVRGSNLSLGDTRFKKDEFVFVSQETANRLLRSSCCANDIIFTKKGTLGQTGIIPSDGRFSKYLLSSNQMKLTVSCKAADPLFVYYYVSSPKCREQIIRESTASGVPKINVAYLRQFPIVLPPLDEQRAIARILGALDDRIELNREMNHTLEAMAQSVFKSWFVDFDPVTAKAAGRAPAWMNADTAALFPSRFVESELGLIPEGWRVGKIREIGKNPRLGVRPNDVSPDTPYIGLEHIPRRSITLSEWGKASDVTSGKFKFKTSEILFGKLRPYFHKVGIAPVDGVCSTDVLVVNAVSQEWFGLLLGHLSSIEFINYVDGASGGTRMPRTDWDVMSKYALVIPSQEVGNKYTQIVKGFIDRIHSNVMESRTLSALRDSLLPKLLSGEIRVRQAEKMMAEAI